MNFGFGFGLSCGTSGTSTLAALVQGATVICELDPEDGTIASTFSPTLKTEAGAALSAANGAKDTIYLDWTGSEYRAWIRKAWA